jgi:hypothetical protein
LSALTPCYRPFGCLISNFLKTSSSATARASGGSSFGDGNGIACKRALGEVHSGEAATAGEGGVTRTVIKGLRRRHRSTVRRGNSTPRWRPVAARWQRNPKKGQLAGRPAAGKKLFFPKKGEHGWVLLYPGACPQGKVALPTPKQQQGNEINTARRSKALLTCRLVVF